MREIETWTNPSPESEGVGLQVIQVTVLVDPSTYVELFWIRENVWVSRDTPIMGWGVRWGWQTAWSDRIYQ